MTFKVLYLCKYTRSFLSYKERERNKIPLVRCGYRINGSIYQQVSCVLYEDWLVCMQAISTPQMFNDTHESESNCRHKALVSFIDYNFYCTWKIRYGLVKIFHFLNPCLCLKLVLLMERSCDVILRVISPPLDLKVSVIIWTNYSGLGRYIQIRYDKLFRCISPVLTRQDIEINAQTWRGI